MPKGKTKFVIFSSSLQLTTNIDMFNTDDFHFYTLDVLENPASISDSNIVWVTKWVDYSNKYGFGFQLSNDVIGVLFNDTSRIVMSPDGR